MATLTNTDLQIYANPFSGLGGGGLLPFLGGGGSTPYGAAFAGLGAPSQGLPLTAAGFLRQSFPEFAGVGGLSAMLPSALSQRYAQFAAGPVTTEGLQQFRSSLAGDEAVQAILRRSELSGGGSILRGVEQARDLSEIVSEQLGTEGSALANIFAGVDPTVATQDIRNLLLGQESALGNLAALSEFGTRGGGLTPFESQAFGAQLLGGSDLIGLGQGMAFNPFSYAVDAGAFTSDIGQQALGGTNLLDLNLGLLSLYDTNITGGVASNLSRAFQTGADVGYGGTGGYGTTTRLANLAPWLQQAGGQITQGGDIAGFIDATYRGLAGRGYGGTLPGLFQQYYQPERAAL